MEEGLPSGPRGRIILLQIHLKDLNKALEFDLFLTHQDDNPLTLALGEKTVKALGAALKS